MTQLDLRFTHRSLQSIRRQGLVVVIISSAVGCDLVGQIFAHFSSPGLLLLPAIALIGMVAGLRSSLSAAAISVGYVAFVYARLGETIQSPHDRLIRLCIMCISAPVVAMVVGMLHRRSERDIVSQLESERDQSAARARTFAQEKAELLTRDQLSQQRANDLIGSIPGIVWEASVEQGQFQVKFVSSYANRLLGYTLKRWTDEPGFWLEIVHPDDRAEVARRIETICNCEGGLPGIDSVPLEFRWMDQSGVPFWVETRLVRSVIEGRCVGFRAVTLDINQRKQLEVALRSRASELVGITESLKRSNQELDQFAYVTSHDLKAPLRGIFNLSQWIEEDLGDRFTPAAREQMRLLRGRVQRMESLINGLLQYAHVGRSRGKVESVDVSALLAEVIDWIAPEPEVHCHIASGMPVISTDRLRLQQVFSNLLGNAVKHNGRSEANITVDCHDLGEYYQFSVADDGRGIEAQYHDRIFGIFQTLLPRDQVEGTGIGLSLVKKIVQSKGGVISVESEPQRGATFRFTWPKTEKESQCFLPLPLIAS